MSINEPKDIQEILTALDNTTKEQLEIAIKHVDLEEVIDKLEERIRLNRRDLRNEGYSCCFDEDIMQMVENLIKGYKVLEEQLYNKQYNKIKFQCNNAENNLDNIIYGDNIFKNKLY